MGESAQGGRSGELLVESYFITEGGGWGAQRSVWNTGKTAEQVRYWGVKLIYNLFGKFFSLSFSPFLLQCCWSHVTFHHISTLHKERGVRRCFRFFGEGCSLYKDPMYNALTDRHVYPDSHEILAARYSYVIKLKAFIRTVESPEPRIIQYIIIKMNTLVLEPKPR